KEYAYLDPDLGWHIRMGEYILAHGLPKTDPLSYTMPNYPIVDMEWVTNIFFAFLYKNFTVLALNVLVTIFCFTTIFVQIQKKYLLWSFLPAFLSFAVLFEFFGIRTQVISWLFFSLLIRVVYDTSLWQKYRYLVPVFMLIWANMHGSFMLGNFVLGLYGSSLIISKKATTVDLLLIVVSIAATLLNPYGFRLWHEVWVQSTDESLHLLNGEWMPIIFDFNLAEGIYFLAFFLLICRYYKKITSFNLFLALLLFAAGCSSIRQIPFFVIASLPLIAQSLSYLNNDAKRYPYGEVRLQKAYSVFLTFIIILSIFLIIKNMNSRIYYSLDELYPTHAVAYLRTHLPKENLLSVVEWGGYLDLSLPQKKIFIDGRMDNWRLTNARLHESS